ncbi:Similar to Vacuolar transporter chaperone 4; acc. no. P78810 [Pyronema omphalodes CBS 100304]|uniref:Similar to Vacuolar transporter chaperone 4 acc. no. P78810 n=1 Tax=Pyronema omphalodes (strain CBS 100304) TaxID=1076935 RepID=U4LLR7_PYROM|nr:Similar to Vacuolar transporter chaperone 4; acc. no. P78810 [Pyronema omphalodes CBS 100304]
MKYGEALPLRSVREWMPYNIDYTEIKQLIKHYTTQNPPVSSPDQHTDFENEVFEVFLDQLQRIDLFVKSKAGEIDRRIANCQRQVNELRQLTPSARGAAKIATRYAKVEQEVERAGHDVQLLSRFVNVQRTGFHKLLKKYRKWSNSSQLPERFLQLLESPTSFHRQDFDQNVLEVSELLKAVRDGLTILNNSDFPVESLQPSRIASRMPSMDFGSLRQAYQEAPESCLDLDVSFGTAAITPKGGRAVFWVHRDYLIELQVFLLRHLVLQNATPEPTRPGTPLLSRRSSSLQPNHNANPPSGIAQQHAASRHTSTTSVAGGDTIGLVVLDNLASFSDVHTSATVDRISQSVMRTAGQIRWCSRDTCASVVVSDHSGTILPRRGPDGVEDAPKEPELLEVKVKRKLVEILINPDAEISKLNDSHSTAKQRHTIQKIREWLRENPGVVPLAKILSHRTRFSGPVTGGLAYAFLDRDVKMMGIEKKEGLAEEVERECLEFPHAILEVRWDGDDVPAFVEELEGSHMVETVPGFSLEVHAIYALHRPTTMSPPFWLPALTKDIRKTPSHARLRGLSSHQMQSGTSSKTSSVGHTTTTHFDPSSPATPMTSDHDTPPRRKRYQRLLRTKKPPITTPQSRKLTDNWYWNEFDDGSDREEAYTVRVRPRTADSVDNDPEGEQSLSAFMWAEMRKMLNWRGKKQRLRAGRREYEPLLGGDSDTEAESELDIARRRYEGGMQMNYTTFDPAMDSYSDHFDNDMINYRSIAHLMLLGMSFFVLLITGALAVGESVLDHKHKRRNIGNVVIIDLGVFVGTLVALGLAGMSGIAFLCKRETSELDA